MTKLLLPVLKNSNFHKGAVYIDAVAIKQATSEFHFLLLYIEVGVLVEQFLLSVFIAVCEWQMNFSASQNSSAYYVNICITCSHLQFNM